MKICSRQGWFELKSFNRGVNHGARSGGIIGIYF